MKYKWELGNDTATIEQHNRWWRRSSKLAEEENRTKIVGSAKRARWIDIQTESQRLPESRWFIIRGFVGFYCATLTVFHARFGRLHLARTSSSWIYYACSKRNFSSEQGQRRMNVMLCHLTSPDWSLFVPLLIILISQRCIHFNIQLLSPPGCSLARSVPAGNMNLWHSWYRICVQCLWDVVPLLPRLRTFHSPTDYVIHLSLQRL